MTEEEFEQVVEAGERLVQVADYDGAYQLLAPVHESGELSGNALGRVAFLLGEACLGLDSLDAASYYLEQAAADAPSDIMGAARTRLDQIGRRDAAADAEYEGVDGDAEAETILAAADDALESFYYDAARGYYEQAYNGVHMTAPQIARAAVGMAECEMHLGRLDEAEGYLQVAENRDSSRLSARITALRAQIAEITAGDTAVEGGIERSELDELHEAGLAASRSRDWDSAHRYFDESYRSGKLGGTDRGWVAYNLAIICLWRRDYDAAVGYFEEARDSGGPGVASRAVTNLDRMQDLNEAEAIVDALDPDRDLAND